ncbi:MAG: hypothetical protein AB7I30_02755 [Isosphaeraceae bacterium]
MSLSREIANAVDHRPAPTTFPCAIEVDDAGHRLALELTAAGPVGLAFERLDYTAADRAERSQDALRAWADRVAARVTYLMEPLKVLEHDREAGAVSVRSQSPSRRNARRTYYEAILRKDGTLTLSRIAYDETTGLRENVPCQMTVEVLERLADDFVASA